jgi:hypothetical protein
MNAGTMITASIAADPRSLSPLLISRLILS